MQASQAWVDWRQLTRFHKSAIIAMNREVEFINETTHIEFTLNIGQSKYTAQRNEHLSTISDHRYLNSAIILYSYALAESAVGEILNIDASKSGGIENWGEQLLKFVQHTWSDVEGGKSGLIEVSIIRNIIAHGGRTFDITDTNRMNQAGGNQSWMAGDPLIISHQTVQEVRARLRSLLRLANIAA